VDAVAEAVHLQALGMSPYAGSVFHAPPLVLQLLEPFHGSSKWPRAEQWIANPHSVERHP
jgi:hypothetical protein